MTKTFAFSVDPAVTRQVISTTSSLSAYCSLYAHMLRAHPRVCVCPCVCVFSGFLPCGAVEFLADYSADAPLCFPAEAGASPLVAMAPSVPPPPASPQVQDATSHATLCL